MLPVLSWLFIMSTKLNFSFNIYSPQCFSHFFLKKCFLWIMIKPMIFSTHLSPFSDIWSFALKKTFLSAWFRIETSLNFLHQIRALDFFFLSVTSKKHFACSVSVCLPDGRFLRLAQGKRLCQMRSELTWPEQAAGEDQGTGAISTLTLQTQEQGPSQRRWEPPRHHAQHEWAAVAYEEMLMKT